MKIKTTLLKRAYLWKITFKLLPFFYAKEGVLTLYSFNETHINGEIFCNAISITIIDIRRLLMRWPDSHR